MWDGDNHVHSLRVVRRCHESQHVEVNVSDVAFCGESHFRMRTYIDVIGTVDENVVSGGRQPWPTSMPMHFRNDMETLFAAGRFERLTTDRSPALSHLRQGPRVNAAPS